MKNLLKFGFLALAISFSVVACNSNKKAEGTDSTAVVAADSTKMAADSTKMTTDSTKMSADSTKMAADTSKKK